MIRRQDVAAALGIAALAAACSQEIQAVDPANLDRPSDIAFACHGDVLLQDGTVGNDAQPLVGCLLPADDDAPDANVSQRPSLFGFVLQKETGTVALITLEVPGEAGRVVDSDPFVPGTNAIPVGTLPVSIATDRSGCFMMTANQGTCDLSVIDVDAAIDKIPSVQRHGIVLADGTPVAAEPGGMVAQEQITELGLGCADGPEGLMYLSLPRCNAVAVVDPATVDANGNYAVVAGIEFDADGNATITDGSLTCPNDCGGNASGAAFGPAIDAGVPDAGVPDAGVPDAGMDPPEPLDARPRPAALHLADDGRLYIGAENAPIIGIVQRGPDGLPTAVQVVRVEGDVGITAMASTGVNQMGGNSGDLGAGTAGQFSFLYAIATDRTVRVVEVDDLVECDTQVDPRFYQDSRNPTELACFAVGAAGTPPRRAGVASPGIPMPRGAVPLDIEIFRADRSGDTDVNAQSQRAPDVLAGVFAMVTTSDGFAHLINVDDDHYQDFEVEGDPLAVYMAQAASHSMRDAIRDRDVPADTCVSVGGNQETSASQFGPRSAFFATVSDNSLIAGQRVDALPHERIVECTRSSTSGDMLTLQREAVSELDFGAPADLRNAAFPDVLSVRNEDFFMIWEGRISLDDNDINLDGPPVRVGVVLEDGPDLRLVDGAAPFCDVGVEPYDIAVLLGCQVNGHCSVGEECVFHPDTPGNVNTGLCLPTERGEELEATCRDLMISTKQYTVEEAFTGHVTLGERRRVLRTTPLDGCSDDAQCAELAVEAARLTNPGQPITDPDHLAPLPEGERIESELDTNEDGKVDERDFAWSCVADPTRQPGPPRCLMTCSAAQPCGEGLACSAEGFCVHAPPPPTACLQSLQRYELRAGDAFSVIGVVDRSVRVTGFLHNIVADPDSGECVAAANPNPLLAGRIPLRGLPECVGDGLTDLAPNPCLTTIESGDVLIYEFDDSNNQCEVVEADRDNNLPVLRTFDVPAIRFRNPVFTMHLVQPSTNGDAQCFGDNAGGLPAYSPVFQNYQMTMRIGGGSAPFGAPIDAALPTRLVKGPRGFLWVLDAGDNPNIRFTRGRVIRLDPTAGDNGFGAGDGRNTII